MRYLTMVLAVFVCFFFFTGSCLAMSSTNYSIEWMVPLSGGSNTTQMTSTNYAADITYGQTAIGEAASTNYSCKLGYWYGATINLFPWIIYMPAILSGALE